MTSPERDLWQKRNGVSLEDRLDWAENQERLRREPVWHHAVVFTCVAIVLIGLSFLIGG